MKPHHLDKPVADLHCSAEGQVYAVARPISREGLDMTTPLPLYLAPTNATALLKEAQSWEQVAKAQDAKLRAMTNEPGGIQRLREVLADADQPPTIVSLPFGEAKKVILAMSADDAKGMAISLLIKQQMEKKYVDLEFRVAVMNYMAAFGQALDAHGIPYGPQQVDADQALRALLKDQP